MADRNPNLGSVFLGGFLPSLQQHRQQQFAKQQQEQQFQQQQLAAEQARAFRQSLADQDNQFRERGLAIREGQAAQQSEMGNLRLQQAKQELEMQPQLFQMKKDASTRAAESHKSKLASERLMRSMKQTQLSEMKALRQARRAAKKEGVSVKFTREEIRSEDGLRGIFQRIDAMNVKPTYKEKLKKAAAQTAKHLETQEFLTREFEAIKGIAGTDGVATIIGGIPLLGRIIPSWRKDADKFEKFKGYLVKLGTQLQQSEPNNKDLQRAAQSLMDISPLDTDETIDQQLSLIKDVLNSRQKEAEMMLVGDGLVGTNTVSIPGMTNFNVVE